MRSILCGLLSCFILIHLSAQTITDSSFVSSHHFKIQSFYVPLSLIGAGILANGNASEGIKKEIVEERNEHMAKFKSPVDNYLQFAPIAVAYGLDAMGVRSKTDIANRTAILIKGELMMAASTYFLKSTTHELRPDGSNRASFPSGHTAQAFAAATFLSEEYKDRLPWMPYAAYTSAAAVGLMRMANNKHYISDILVGAGLGIIAMKCSYLTHRYKWGKKNHLITDTGL